MRRMVSFGAPVLALFLMGNVGSCDPADVDAFCLTYRKSELEFSSQSIRGMTATDRRKYLAVLNGTEALCKGKPGW